MVKVSAKDEVEAFHRRFRDCQAPNSWRDTMPYSVRTILLLSHDIFKFAVILFKICLMAPIMSTLCRSFEDVHNTCFSFRRSG